MTDTTSTTELSGVDLARVALLNARAAAKSRPEPKRRTGASPTRRALTGDRDPQPFGAAITQMMAERGWDMAARGGIVIDQWPTIAPELAGKVAAVAFDEDTRTLHLRPVSPAYRTQIDLYQRQITAKINATVGDDTVRHLKILVPGPVSSTADPRPVNAPARGVPAPDGQPAEPRPRNPGYLKALAAHQTSRLNADRSEDPDSRRTRTGPRTRRTARCA
ncbi:DciA family protein [Streptomyces sp. 35G-GA-8]|uniref:DciA family protein n=1 Tax=Streptomyces sp. 35G-GA-8 TaxID=2939434 RepID=UPI00201F4D38|nr:DciA family protein [Streptomyces sp. 35G-GA-8]MCL7382184.1 DciA family protein [Streptomyces sp. 35G-GA-8]